MMARWLMAASFLWLGGCNGCVPSLPLDDDEDSDQESDTPPVDTAPEDTAPPPPCDVPEVEDNASIETATVLGLELEGCGEFSSTTDYDFWVYEVAEPDWIAVRFQARQLGSWAQVQAAISTEDVRSSVVARTGHGTLDATVVYPASAGEYTALLSDVNFQGDKEHFQYRWIVSVVKPPVEWDFSEVDVGNGLEDATRLSSGEVVFGDMDTDGDQDWYWVDVPVDKHTVVVDIDAKEFGSNMNPFLIITNENGDVLDQVDVGQEGWEEDPWVEYVSPGDELLFFDVVDAHGNSGNAYWYTLTISVEGS